MESWIADQVEYNSSQWEENIRMFYPDHLMSWIDPKENFRHLFEVWNTLDAVRLLEWEKYLRNVDSVVLDIGGGTGWLSAYLSKIQNISKIYMLDSSRYFLEKMFPEIVCLMEGDIGKITPIEGFFTPLLLENNSVDLVVASSSTHHAENVEFLFEEIYRVMKDDGFFVILNETPVPNYKYFSYLLLAFTKIFLNTAFRKYTSRSPAISSSGYLYDPYLGDKMYPDWYWEKAIRKANLNIIDRVKTPYFPTKKDNKGVRLTHFICRKQLMDFR